MNGATSSTIRHLSLHNDGHVQRQCPSKTAQLWEIGCLPHVCTRKLQDLHDPRRPPCQCAATGESLWETKEICMCATTRMSTNTTSLYDHRDVHSLDELHKEVINNLVKVLQLRSFHSLQHEEHVHNDAHVNKLVQELDAEATSGSVSNFKEKLREKHNPL